MLAKRTQQKRLSLAELRTLATTVGFPDPNTAAAVAMAESGGDPGAVGDNGSSFGLWQIHTPAHPEYTAASLMTPGFNAVAAKAISKNGVDWSPWSTFKSGAYKKYLAKGNA